MDAHVEPRLQHCSLVWTIENFKLRRNPTAPIESPEYILKTWFTTKWKIVLSFDKNAEDVIYFSLTLKRCGVDAGIGHLLVKCKLTLDLSTCLEIAKDHVFQEVDSLYFNEISTLNEVFESDDLIKRDSFVVRIEILVNEPKKVVSGFIKESLLSLSNELKFLYENQVFTDLVIKAESRRFKVHKSVFIARCSGFYSLLRYDTKKKLVKVPKAKAEVVEKLIYFMYTGDIYSYLNDPVLDVCEFAEEFGMDDLEQISKPEEIVANTTFSAAICKFSWSLENFSELSKNINSIINSPAMNMGRQAVLWHLQLRVYRGYFSLFVELENPMPELVVCFEASVLNSKRKKAFVKETSVLKCGKYGFPSFVDLDYLKGHPDLLTNDTLRLQCVLKISDDVVKETHVNHEFFMCTASKKCNSYTKLSNDILSIYENGNRTDITVLVDNQRLELHKCILAARCPALHAIISSNKCDTIEITEIDLRPFEEMIRYMYSGVLTQIDLGTAVQIYSSAKGFDMVLLFDMCSTVLQKHMSPDCVCCLLKLAHEFCDFQLKKAIINFVCFNSGEVLQREEWQYLKQEYPLLIEEVMSALAFMTAEHAFLENEIECVQEELV